MDVACENGQISAPSLPMAESIAENLRCHAIGRFARDVGPRGFGQPLRPDRRR
jgi:hypothetical protein